MSSEVDHPPTGAVPAPLDSVPGSAAAVPVPTVAVPASSADDGRPVRQVPAAVPVRHGSNRVPAPTDGDNRYKAVQHKLKAFSGALDGATGRLEALRRRMRATADRASTLAGHIADAGLDPVFVEMTNAVALALDGAALATGRLHESAQAVSADASETQRTHARMYEALDQIRSGRKHRTPKPGFFARN
ncbi:conjugal transfer protein TraB [Streptomyces sp. NRRL B-24484]|uniref:conjugal transfer protein TraB n=1 Tax=Streptomyces sp. NRRL B-24484 TaxID=1463833 RepID=UPI002D21BF1B|nr:conjugal transfer protein TraB [Streptomyces sp. NRRL B-24484]